MTNPFDTQKVRLDLMQELLAVEEQAIQTTDLSIINELAEKIRWLKSKLAFLESPEYQDRKVFNVEPLDRDQLDETLRDYCCATCWGPLTFRYIDGAWYALCIEHKEETTGYTSKRFAERQRETSESELIEAAHNLRDVLGLKPERQSKEKNLSDLGF